MCYVLCGFQRLGLRSKGSTKRIKCTFLNHADTKVVLYTIDEKGKMHKVAKMKDGKKEVIDTFEGNIFLARSKKRKLRGRSLVINNNILYAVTAEDGDNDRVKAEILRGPGMTSIMSIIQRKCSEGSVLRANDRKFGRCQAQTWRRARYLWVKCGVGVELV